MLTFTLSFYVILLTMVQRRFVLTEYFDVNMMQIVETKYFMTRNCPFLINVWDWNKRYRFSGDSTFITVAWVLILGRKPTPATLGCTNQGTLRISPKPRQMVRVISQTAFGIWCLGTWLGFLVLMVPQPQLILGFTCSAPSYQTYSTAHSHIYLLIIYLNRLWRSLPQSCTISFLHCCHF